MAKISPVPSIFINDLDQIDIAFPSLEGISGKSIHVGVKASGPLDRNGFIFDFSILKKEIKKTLKNSADHALIIPSHSKSIVVSHDEMSGTSQVSHQVNGQFWGYHCPTDSLFFIDSANFSLSSLKEKLEAHLNQVFSELDIVISLTEKEPKSELSTFYYTHGISGHNGLCQRLFHGHTGEIDLQISGASSDENNAILRLLRSEYLKNNIHIASKEQIVKNFATQKIKIAKGISLDKNDYLHLSYTGSKGYFEAILPKSNVLVLEKTTSIEHLTMGVYEYLEKNHLTQINKGLKLSLQEGIKKGAIVDTTDQ